MICPKCQTKNTDSASHCVSCGTDLANVLERRQLFAFAGLLLVGLFLVFCGIIVNPEFLVSGAVFLGVAGFLRIKGHESIRRLREGTVGGKKKEI